MSRYADPAETGADEILAAMERAVFAPHEFEIPVGKGLLLQSLQRKKCASCGGQARRSVYDLKLRERRLFCEACR